jgi:hypothetical protein
LPPNAKRRHLGIAIKDRSAKFQRHSPNASQWLLLASAERKWEEEGAERRRIRTTQEARRRKGRRRRIGR